MKGCALLPPEHNGHLGCFDRVKDEKDVGGEGGTAAPMRLSGSESRRTRVEAVVECTAWRRGKGEVGEKGGKEEAKRTCGDPSGWLHSLLTGSPGTRSVRCRPGARGETHRRPRPGERRCRAAGKKLQCGKIGEEERETTHNRSSDGCLYHSGLESSVPKELGDERVERSVGRGVQLRKERKSVRSDSYWSRRRNETHRNNEGMFRVTPLRSHNLLKTRPLRRVSLDLVVGPHVNVLQDLLRGVGTVSMRADVAEERGVKEKEQRTSKMSITFFFEWSNTRAERRTALASRPRRVCKDDMLIRADRERKAREAHLGSSR